MSERSHFLMLGPDEPVRRLLLDSRFSQEAQQAAVASFICELAKKAPGYNFPKFSEQVRAQHLSFLDELFDRETVWSDSCELTKKEAGKLHACVIYAVGDEELRAFGLGAVDNKGKVFTVTIRFQPDVRPLVVIEASKEMVDRDEDFFLHDFMSDNRILLSSVMCRLSSYFRGVAVKRQERLDDAEDDFRRAHGLYRLLDSQNRD